MNFSQLFSMPLRLVSFKQKTTKTLLRFDGDSLPGMEPMAEDNFLIFVADLAGYVTSLLGL
jgi:hypothetical protein